MRWPLGIYRVAGDSMLPHYRPGQTLLGWRWFRPRPGQAVIARQGGRPLLKRVAKLSPNQVWLLGDNVARSTDSRHFGPLPHGQLEAIIIARLG